MTSRFQLQALAVLALCAALPGCTKEATAVEERPTPVKIARVDRSPNAGKARYSGTLEPASEVKMAFRVSGYVDALGQISVGGRARAIDKGDFVQKGTVLARVRAIDYQHKVATAQAQVSEARASERLAKSDLERAQKLFEARVITRAELDANVARADSAKAALEDALARSGEAGLSLSDTVLRAPMDGVILERQVEVGTLVSPGQPAVTVADTRTVKAVFGAPQALVERLAVGDAVQVFYGAESEAKTPEKLLTARVTRIAPAADTSGRVFSIETALDNPSGELRPGSVVSIRVPSAAPDALVVPLSAVLRSPQEPRAFSVFVLEGETERAAVKRVSVSLGEVVGNAVTVNQGLAQNDRVVTVGATLLRDGGSAVVIR
jgi:RND family efflux transporter MFP subunit